MKTIKIFFLCLIISLISVNFINADTYSILILKSGIIEHQTPEKISLRELLGPILNFGIIEHLTSEKISVRESLGPILNFGIVEYNQPLNNDTELIYSSVSYNNQISPGSSININDTFWFYCWMPYPDTINIVFYDRFDSYVYDTALLVKLNDNMFVWDCRNNYGETLENGEYNFVISKLGINGKFIVDNTPPVSKFDSVSVNNILKTVNLTVTMNDNYALATTKLFYRDINDNEITVFEISKNIPETYSAQIKLKEYSDYIFYLIVTDSAGNSATAVQTVNLSGFSADISVSPTNIINQPGNYLITLKTDTVILENNLSLILNNGVSLPIELINIKDSMEFAGIISFERNCTATIGRFEWQGLNVNMLNSKTIKSGETIVIELTGIVFSTEPVEIYLETGAETSIDIVLHNMDIFNQHLMTDLKVENHIDDLNIRIDGYNSTDSVAFMPGESKTFKVNIKPENDYKGRADLMLTFISHSIPVVNSLQILANIVDTTVLKPDIVIKPGSFIINNGSNNSVNIKEPVTISVKVYNYGLAAADNIKVQIKLFENIIFDGIIDRIEAGSNKVLNFNYLFNIAGEYLLIAEADYDNGIDEYYEDNNLYSSIILAGVPPSILGGITITGKMNYCLREYPEELNVYFLSDPIEITGYSYYTLFGADYPVYSGEAIIKIRDVYGNIVYSKKSYTGGNRALGGKFNFKFLPPAKSGRYFVTVYISDKTYTNTKTFKLNVYLGGIEELPYIDLDMKILNPNAIIVENMAANFEVEIINNGNINSPASVCIIEKNNIYLTHYEIEPLLPEKKIKLKFPAEFQNYGKHLLSAEVNRDRIFEESTYSNNKASMFVDITPKWPDLTGTAAEPVYYDISVLKVPYCSETLPVNITIYNKGYEVHDTDFTIALYSNNKFIDTQIVEKTDTLPFTLLYEFIPDTISNVIKIIIDSTDAVKELNENNNIHSRKYPDILPVSIRHTQGIVSEKSSADFYVTVRNSGEMKTGEFGVIYKFDNENYKSAGKIFMNENEYKEVYLERRKFSVSGAHSLEVALIQLINGKHFVQSNVLNDTLFYNFYVGAPLPDLSLTAIEPNKITENHFNSPTEIFLDMTIPLANILHPKVYCYVYNFGDTLADNAVVRLYQDNRLIDTRLIERILPGESKKVEFNNVWTPELIGGKLRLTVNDNRVISEKEYKNNELWRSYNDLNGEIKVTSDIHSNKNVYFSFIVRKEIQSDLPLPLCKIRYEIESPQPGNIFLQSDYQITNNVLTISAGPYKFNTGEHTAKLYIDYDNVIPEKTKANNIITATFNVRNPLPDMLIKDVVFKPAILTQNISNVEITVKYANEGETVAYNPVMRLQTANPTQTMNNSLTAPAIVAIGAIYEQKFVLPVIDNSTQYIKIELDYENKINELNENNNLSLKYLANIK